MLFYHNLLDTKAQMDKERVEKFGRWAIREGCIEIAFTAATGPFFRLGRAATILTKTDDAAKLVGRGSKAALANTGKTTRYAAVSDAGVYLNRVGSGNRKILDDLLAQGDFDLILPKAIRAEVQGVDDITRLSSSVANVQPVRSANVAEILRKYPSIKSYRFGVEDIKLVATAKSRGLPVITTNKKLINQIRSHPLRQQLFGDVKILVPGEDFNTVAELRQILGN